jgi:thiamine kinase-like enzyme
MLWIPVFCLFFQLLFSSEITPYLQACSLPEDQVQVLTGGYSGAQHYKIVDGARNLVLKLYPKGYPESKQAKRELATMLHASRAGIAPKIHWVSDDRRAVLMDCAEGKWLSMAEAKKPENIIAMANTLRQVHELPKSPLVRQSTEARMEELFEILKCGYHIPPELERAIERKKGLHVPENGPKVTIHGDLNPRNIFLTEKGVKLIDWSETCWEDPFFDLACFALLHNLNEEEEELFLHTYLGSSEEKGRYHLVKEISLIDQAVNLIYLANSLSDDLQDGPVEEWSFYTTLFAESAENLTPQLLYDWGRCCLLAIDVAMVGPFDLLRLHDAGVF